MVPKSQNVGERILNRLGSTLRRKSFDRNDVLSSARTLCCRVVVVAYRNERAARRAHLRPSSRRPPSGLPRRSVPAVLLTGPKTPQIGPGPSGTQNGSDLITFLIESQRDFGGLSNRRIRPPGAASISTTFWRRSDALELRSMFGNHMKTQWILMIIYITTIHLEN